MRKTEDRNTDVLPYPTRNPKVAPDTSSREGDSDRHHALIVNFKKDLRPLTQIGWQFFSISRIRPCTAPGILAHQEPLMLVNILSNPPGLDFIAMRQTMNALYQRHLSTFWHTMAALPLPDHSA